MFQTTNQIKIYGGWPVISCHFHRRQGTMAGPGQTIHLAGQSVEGGARIGPARPLSFPGGEMDMVPFRFRNCDSYMSMVVISCYFIALGDSEWRYLYLYILYIICFYISIIL